jgi:hypothetical protein
MTKRNAGLLFLLVSAVPAILLLAGAIPPIVSGCIFALALVVFGVLSMGFRRQE